MPVHRYPVLILEDHTGLFTAVLAEGWEAPWDGEAREELEVAAVAARPEAALAHLEDLLQQQGREDPEELPEPLLAEPRLTELVVPLKAAYRDGPRLHTSPVPVRLQVPCVYGGLRGGGELQLVCLPTLGLRFSLLAGEDLRQQVRHLVEARMRGWTPAQLARYLPARSVRLGEAVVRLPAERRLRVRDLFPLPTLEQVAEALGEARLRRLYNPAWEREAQVVDLVARLSSERANVLLVGEAGAGKTALLVDAVGRLVRAGTLAPGEEEAPDRRRARRRFWRTSGQRLIAGMKYLGEWQARCEQVVEELGSVDGILCVESLPELLQVGGIGPEDSVAAFFLPYLQAGELRLVAETTPAGLQTCRRLAPSLLEQFQILTLPPLNRAQELRILDRILASRRQNTQLEADPGVAALVHGLFARFMPYSAFPARAAGFLRRLGEQVEQERGTATAGMERKVALLTRARVTEQFIRESGLPEVFVRDDLPLELETVRGALEREVIGQPRPCLLAAQVVATFKAGLNDPRRPIGTLLFCGPTGVGKTQLARSLARFCFGHGQEKERLVRLDMSEYSGPDAAARLLGDPWRNQAGELVEQVRRQPFVVLLFDEIEKAAPEVFDLLLGLLDEGRLTDAYGRVTDFRSAIVIMTSNLGAAVRENAGFGRNPAGDFRKEVQAFFRPELLNRMDEIVLFGELDRESVRLITAKELRELAEREGLSRRGLKLVWEEEVLEQLVEAGFDRRYGARNLQRTLEEKVVSPLARLLVDRELPPRARLRLVLGQEKQVEIRVES